jgi:type VI secretion system protein ImpG
MTTALYPYYEKELHFIRKDAEEFAKQYPAAAGQLLLERNGSRDPHVERLIEGFALLAARVQHKLDDDFPEISDGLLSMLYPHYLAPIPSMAIAQFRPDAKSPKPNGLKIGRGTGLRSPAVDGVACRYRTCYPVTVWPVEVADARLETAPFDRKLAPPRGTAGVLRIRLKAQANLHFDQLQLDQLRFHLHGDNGLMATLYELLFNHVTQVVVADGDETGAPRASLLPDQAIAPVGFGTGEGLLPYLSQSSEAYRLLTELFAFPDKFAFFDLHGLDGETLDGAGREIDVLLYLDRIDEDLVGEINADTFRLGSTPIVNLFKKVCEPIRLTHRRTEYPIKPALDQRDAMEIYSVDKVTGVRPGQFTRYAPFYGLNHENSWSGDDEARAYWQARRQPSPTHNDRGTDVLLRLVDLDFNPHEPADDSVTVEATCTNRDLPNRLPPGPAGLRFELESALPVGSVRCLRHPTAPLRPPLGGRAHWRLVSHLALNHLSLSDATHSTAALQEILRLYDFTNTQTDSARAIANSEMIDGIHRVHTRRTVARIGTANSGGFCQGVAVELELDEHHYRSVGGYLFASVLERFFALYCTVNSFTQLHFSTKQNGVKRVWLPRSGEAELL